MRNLTYTVIAFAAALFTPLPLTNAGDFKLEPGFTLLFNGKNLDGWREKGKKESLDGKTEAFKGRFKVQKGALMVDYELKNNSYIETTKEFAKDVHVKFDFKAGAGCNNDILFRDKKFDIVPGKNDTKKIKEGEWYTFELIATGDTLEHKINGEVLRTTKGVKAIASTLVLRAEFGIIEIKNIRVKE